MPSRDEAKSPDPQWLLWSRRLQAIAQDGLTYTRDGYDLGRYAQLRELAAEIFATLAFPPTSTRGRLRLVRANPEDCLPRVTPLYEPPGDLPHLRPGRLHLDARFQPSIRNHSRQPGETTRSRPRPHFVEQDEAVEPRTTRQVELPGVELYLRRSRCPEAYAGPARHQHRERVPKHLPADRFEDQMVRTPLPGRRTALV